jgi:hypothetical protein
LYRERHKEERSLCNKARRKQNSEIFAARDKAKYEKHKKKILISNATRRRKRLQNDLGYRLLDRLGARLRGVLKSQRAVKSSTAMTLVGCTKAELMVHLQSQFRPGMSWNNYGPVWHVDHIKPCCLFDLMNPEDQRACFHFTNLQPLFGEENCRKAGRYVA